MFLKTWKYQAYLFYSFFPEKGGHILPIPRFNDLNFKLDRECVLFQGRVKYKTFIIGNGKRQKLPA